MMKKLKRIKESVKMWNKKVFGDTREIKRGVIERIQRLDKKEEEITIAREEIEERRSLRNKLEEVIFKDAVVWKQKMKIRWIKEWDNNSKLFHMLVNNRRNNNTFSIGERRWIKPGRPK